MNTPLPRREFLKQSGRALTVAAFGASAFLLSAQAPAPKRTLKKGYMLNTFPARELPLLEKFKLLKAAGFDGVEPPSHLDREELLRARDETGLAIPSVTCGAHSRLLSHPAPSERAKGIEGLKHALQDAKAYGAASVLTVAGIVDKNISYADAWNRTREGIQQAVPLAEELGVKIAVENVWNHFLLSPLEAARYVDEFNSPVVAWHFDIGNVMYLGWPEHWIRALGKRIVQLHIKEFSRKKMNEQGLRAGFAVEYLEGDNDWPTIMRALDEIGYAGWAIVEPAYRPADVGAQARLRTISEKLDQILAS